MIATKIFEGIKYRKVDSFREMDEILRKREASTIISLKKTDGIYEYYMADGHGFYIRTDSVCYEYNNEFYLHFKTAKDFAKFVEDEYGTLSKIKINHITKDAKNQLQYCDILISVVAEDKEERFTYKISIDDDSSVNMKDYKETEEC